MGGSEWSNKPRFIQEDENSDAENETCQTTKQQPSTGFEMFDICEEP